MPRIYSLGDLLNDLGILQMEFGKPDDEQEDEIAAEARIDYRRAWARQYASLGFRRLRLLAQADGCLFYGKDWPDRATKWLLQQRAKAALDRGIEPVALNAEPVELLAKLIEHRPAEQPMVMRPDDPRDKWIYDQVMAGVPYSTIRFQLKQNQQHWQIISSEQGIRQAAMRCAQRHNLPIPPRRRRGRPGGRKN